jgi:uncharacterized membrane protein
MPGLEPESPVREAGATLDLPTSTGLPPRVAACLAYAAWWVSGGIVLAAEPRHPFVRFHARQALVGFGVIWLAGVTLWATSFLAAFVSPWLFRAAAALANLVWGLGLVAWVACLVAAARGRAWSLPLLDGRRPGA